MADLINEHVWTVHVQPYRATFSRTGISIATWQAAPGAPLIPPSEGRGVWLPTTWEHAPAVADEILRLANELAAERARARAALLEWLKDHEAYVYIPDLQAEINSILPE